MTSLRRGSRPGKRRPEGTERGTEKKHAADRTAIRQGAAILAVLVLLAAGIFLLDPIQRWLAAGPELVVTASGSRSLKVGAPVWVAGIREGRVTSVELRPPDTTGGDRVVIRAVLHEDAAPHLRIGARARIQRPTLLSPPVLAVDPGPPDAPPFDYRDTLRVVKQVSARELKAAADTVRAEAEALLAQGRAINRMLERGPGTLGRLNRDTALRQILRRDLEAVRRLRAALDDHRGLAALRDVRKSGLLDSLARRAARIQETAPERTDALAELRRSLAALERRAGRLDSLTAAGTGTLGRLRADGELREQIEHFRDSLPHTRKVLFADPFRWLRIRIF